MAELASVEEVRPIIWDCVRTHVAAGGKVLSRAMADRMGETFSGGRYRDPPASVCLIGAIGARSMDDDEFELIASVLKITLSQVRQLEAGFEEWDRIYDNWENVQFDVNSNPFVALGKEIATTLEAEAAIAQAEAIMKK